MNDIFAILDQAHRALRRVDASDTREPQEDATLDAVSEAIAAIEFFAGELRDFRLSEFTDQKREA